MRFTEAERAEIGALLRKAAAEGKNTIHVIPSRGGWRVVRRGARRARRAFLDKDQAVAFGRDWARRLKSELVVHTKDAWVEKVENFSEAC
jgi:hypothetical protein